LFSDTFVIPVNAITRSGLLTPGLHNMAFLCEHIVSLFAQNHIEFW